MVDYVQFEVSFADEACDLWNREIGADFPMKRRLFAQNCLSNTALLRSGSVAALDSVNGRLAGLVIAKLSEAKAGYISILLVDRGCRGQGIGSALLARAETALAAEGAETISWGTDPGHFLPGIPAEYCAAKLWAERRGYRKTGTTHDLIGYFRGAGEPPRSDEVSYELAEPADLGPLQDFMHKHFPGRWEQSTAAYRAAGGTGREFVLARRGEQMIGFCRINDADAPVLAGNQFWTPGPEREGAGIGPLGIAAEYRGKGYGLAVVQAGLQFLLERGIRTVTIDWTTEVGFYRKLGFDIWKTYDLYSRELRS